MNEVIFNCQDLNKSYDEGKFVLSVLKDINLTIHQKDRIAIVGPSGSGKSTLLHLLGGLDKPTSGQVLIHGMDWFRISEKKRCQLRNKYLGFVYQFHHLLPEFTALENVSLPLLLAGMSISDINLRAKKILEQVGLSARLSHKPSELSGGERQRVAIARALVNQPQCIIADEPTGNLDNATAQKVFELMLYLNEHLNTALIIVTHDKQLAAKMDTILTIQDGCLVS